MPLFRTRARSAPRVASAASIELPFARGQALVEFALALPIFLVLLFGIIDFGRIIAMQSAAVTASREGARYGAAVGDGGSPPYMDCAGIRNAAQQATQALISISDPNQIEISYVDGAGNPTTDSCPPHGTTGPVEADIDPLDRVVVEVTLQYEAITPMVRAMIGPIDVVSTDRRTIVKAGP